MGADDTLEAKTAPPPKPLLSPLSPWSWLIAAVVFLVPLAYIVSGLRAP